MVIAEHTVVALRYKMQNGRGDVLEDLLEGSPVEYVHGSGNILPALEIHLSGLNAGDKKEILVSKGSPSFDIDDDFSFHVVIDNVRSATAAEIASGLPQDLVEIEDCGPGCIC